MTPAARLQAAIELLEDIEATARPADAVASAWFRARRFIGSHDRPAIAESVYAVLRRRARLRWWLERAGVEPRPRLLVLASLMLGGGKRYDTVAELCSGGRFGPLPLSPEESRLLQALDSHTLDHPEMPEVVALECPPWAEESLRRSLGARFGAELKALLAPAPLDVRVNPIRAERPAVLARLSEAGLQAAPSPWSPYGIRLQGRPPLAGTELFKGGAIEIQDEGSQLVALLADARPGQQVVDFCAGAGGKALALAAAMANKGRVVACDVLGRRLERAAERLRRAGVHNVETRALSSERDPWVKRHKGLFDRVVVDAPCSGTGTWRRNPDSRWRLLGPGLPELVKLQCSILDSAARLVKPGGRLVYATCSLLDDENRDQVDAFLASHPEFRAIPAADVWRQVIPDTPVPFDGPYLQLTPARHHTDAFFTAVLERVKAEPKVVSAEPAAEPAAG